MKSFIKLISQSLFLMPGIALGLALAAPAVVHAQQQPPGSTDCSNVSTGISGGAQCAKPSKAGGKLFGQNSIFTTVTDILLFIIGAISVIMLIIGGIRYVLSGGDQGAVTSAKNTILYAIIGIVVAFLAYAAVIFVTNQLEKTNGNGQTPSAATTSRLG